MNRRILLASGAAALGSFGSLARTARAQDDTPLEVAYAGSMGSMMEGPIETAAAQTLHVAMHGRGQGSDALAKLIVGGSIAPDVFVPVTSRPMLTVLNAGKAKLARPVARTEMVIAYSPKSAYAQQFADAAAGKRGATPWWQLLQRPGIRFGRTDPTVDPQGRNIIFTLQLAETFYKQPGLAQKIIGQTINPAQIFSEPTVEARLQSGELDAASAYKIQPGPFDLPYIRLPREINLGDQTLHDTYARTSLELAGTTYTPDLLIYYAAVLEGAAHPAEAAAFVDWLAAGAQPIFKTFFYDAPAGAAALHV